MEARVVRDGAWWLGRKFIDDAVFRHEFGVYPRTMVWICTTLACDVTWTLKSLWWLKNYPTDEGIANQGASPSYFRAHLWPQLQLLKEKLPEVSEKTSSLLSHGAAAVSLALPFQRDARVVCRYVRLYQRHDNDQNVQTEAGARGLRPLRIPLLEPAQEDVWRETRGSSGDSADSSSTWRYCGASRLA